MTAKRKRYRSVRRRVTELQRRVIAWKQRWRCKSCDKLLPPMFHVDHIKPLHRGGRQNWRTDLQCLCLTCHGEKTLLETLAGIDGENVFDVKCIHHHQHRKGRFYFLVEWEHYPRQQDWTWEPATNLDECSVYHQYVVEHPVSRR